MRTPKPREATGTQAKVSPINKILPCFCEASTELEYNLKSCSATTTVVRDWQKHSTKPKRSKKVKRVRKNTMHFVTATRSKLKVLR